MAGAWRFPGKTSWRQVGITQSGLINRTAGSAGAAIADDAFLESGLTTPTVVLTGISTQFWSAHTAWQPATQTLTAYAGDTLATLGVWWDDSGNNPSLVPTDSAGTFTRIEGPAIADGLYPTHVQITNQSSPTAGAHVITPPNVTDSGDGWFLTLRLTGVGSVIDSGHFRSAHTYVVPPTPDPDTIQACTITTDGTAAAVGDLVIAMFQIEAYSNPNILLVGPPAPWVELGRFTNVVDNIGYLACYKIATASGAQSCSISWTDQNTFTVDAAIAVWAKATSGSITGTATITLGALTTTSAATLSLAAAASVTLGALTSSSAATLGLTGQSAVTLGALTSVSAAALGIAGGAGITLGALTGSSAGNLPLAATASVTLGVLTTTSVSTLSLAGAAGITLGALTASATGDLPLNAAASVTLGTLTVSATGAGDGAPIAGTVSVTLGELVATGAATVALSGQAGITLGALTASSAARLDLSAAGSLTLGSLTSMSAAALGLSAGASNTLAPLTCESAATISASSNSGTASILLGALTCLSAGGNPTPPRSAWRRAPGGQSRPAVTNKQRPQARAASRPRPT